MQKLSIKGYSQKKNEQFKLKQGILHILAIAVGEIIHTFAIKNSQIFVLFNKEM